MASSPDKATFALDLEGNLPSAAKDAAQALEHLKQKIDADTKALREMQKAQRNLKGATGEGAKAAADLKDKIAAQKATIAAAQGQYVQLGGTFGNVAKGAGGLAAIPWAAIGAGILAVAVSIAAVTAAAIAATATLLRYAVGHANARRAELLHLEGLTTIRRWYGLAGGSATEMQAQIDRVSDSVAVGRGALVGYAESLHRAGLRGQDAADALELVGTVASVQGEAQARRYLGLAVATARYGGSVSALAATIDQRLGGIARRRMLDLDVQTAKLRENLNRLFSGLRIEGLLQKISELASLFSQTTVTGRALKAIVETLLQPLIGSAEDAVPLVQALFQEGVILALQFANAVLRLRIWLHRTFADRQILGGVDALNVAFYAAAVVGASLLVILGGIALALVVVAASALLIMAPFLLVALALGAIIVAGVKLIGWLSGQDWAGVGGGIVDGLVDGIRRGAGGFVDTIRGLATAAKGAFTEALGIASPSRVFANLGAQIPAGVAQGVTAGTPLAAGAVESMIEPEGLGAGGNALGGGSVTINGDIVINAQTDTPRELATAFRDELAKVLEGVRVEMGAPA